MPTSQKLKWLTIDDKKFEIKDLDKYTMKELKELFDWCCAEMEEFQNTGELVSGEIVQRNNKKKK